MTSTQPNTSIIYVVEVDNYLLFILFLSYEITSCYHAILLKSSSSSSSSSSRLSMIILFRQQRHPDELRSVLYRNVPERNAGRKLALFPNFQKDQIELTMGRL